MNVKSTCLALAALFVTLLTSCGTSSPIQRYSESKSHFMTPPKLMAHNYPDQDIYRIYHRGATGFVPISALRQNAEERAEKFCARQGRSMKLLGEKISPPPYILGNFPRIEIVFAAVPGGSGGSRSSGADEEGASRLVRLKKLRDQGVISAQEFETEKQRYLSN